MARPPGGTMKIVVDNECRKETFEMLFGTPEECMDPYPFDLLWQKEEVLNVDHRGFIAARDANKIVHDYAVTKLPFILLCDLEDKPYAALYSEEGPITIERINAKS